jgi:hypothetical protein
MRSGLDCQVRVMLGGLLSVSFRERQKPRNIADDVRSTPDVSDCARGGSS